jgi:hypothetical protein
MQNIEKNRQEPIQQYVKSAAHHGKKSDKQMEDFHADEMIDTEVPGDSYYKQYGDDETELQKLFSKE